MNAEVKKKNAPSKKRRGAIKRKKWELA